MIRSVSKMYACKHTSCCNVKDWEPLHPTRQSWRVKDPTSNFVSSRLCATCASSSGVSSLKSQEVQGAKNIGGFPQSWCKGKSCSVLTIDTPHIDTLLPGQDATKKHNDLQSVGYDSPVVYFTPSRFSEYSNHDFPKPTFRISHQPQPAAPPVVASSFVLAPTGRRTSQRCEGSQLGEKTHIAGLPVPNSPSRVTFFLFQTHIIRHRYVLLLLLHVLVLAGKEVAICAGNFKSQLLNTGGTRCKSTGWKNWRPFR